MTESNDVRVILVGHCRPDQFMLKSAIESLVTGAAVVSVNDAASVDAQGTGGLFLVNRVLDGDFASTDGIALVERLAAGGGRAMLISNLSEALAESESRGGLPGFGKSELRSERMQRALENALSAT